MVNQKQGSGWDGKNQTIAPLSENSEEYCFHENPPSDGPFAGGRRWLGPYSPRRGCVGLAAGHRQNLSPQDPL